MLENTAMCKILKLPIRYNHYRLTYRYCKIYCQVILHKSHDSDIAEQA